MSSSSESENNSWDAFYLMAGGSSVQPLLQAAAGVEAELARQYVWGARRGHRDELVLRYQYGERLWCLMDYYDPTSVVDDSGAVMERYRFSAFGLRTILAPDFSPRSISSYAWDFAFKGQFLDIDTGYYNYGYRYYSPYLGRWLSRDPIGEADGPNLYGYTKNSPVSRIDSKGLITLVTAFHGDYGSRFGYPSWSAANTLFSQQKSGTFVQHITGLLRISDCEDHSFIVEEDFDFWEVNGGYSPALDTKPNYGDSSRTVAGGQVVKGTYGTFESLADIRYYEEDAVGYVAYQVGHIGVSAPAVWASNPTDTGSRYHFVSWSWCCGGKSEPETFVRAVSPPLGI